MLVIAAPEENDQYVPLIYIFAILIISRYTKGFFWGVISAVVSVIIVNFAFTIPYMTFSSSSISSYPVTFFCFLITALFTSTSVADLKYQEKMKTEIEKEKMRSNLLRAVSHDLRTPLTSISGVADALIENGNQISEEKKTELLKEIDEESKWLIRMVENLLSVTRINGDNAKISKSPEIAEEIVGESVEKFTKRYPNVIPEVSVPDELLIVPMDPMLIEQVIINLLENAYLHGKKESGIKISIHTDSTLKNAVFEVSDEGKGIAKEDFEHLFSGAWTNSHYTDETDKKRGMGIGLSVCKSIIDAHGGKIRAQNKLSGGAVFEFTLPLEKQND